MSLQATRKRAADSATIPDRLYFKIGDVARICGLETYVLRFWESQFPQLKPNKSGTGQRLYRRRDVEMVLEIKRLVHEEGYTLPGARQALEMTPKRPSLVREAQAKLPAVEAEPGNLATGRSDPGSSDPGVSDPGISDIDTRMDSVAAAIGRARAELRELAGLLAAPAVQPPRRRSRLANISSANIDSANNKSSSGSLFPS